MGSRDIDRNAMKSVTKDWQKKELKKEAAALPNGMNLTASIKVIITGKSINARRVKFRTTALKSRIVEQVFIHNFFLFNKG
jgi:hypothetical protein